MKTIFTILFMALGSFMMAQSNFLNPIAWTVGNGSAPGYNAFGTDASNTRELGNGPRTQDQNAVLWKGVPNDAGPVEGGFRTDFIENVDSQSTYRVSVWVKKTNSWDGRIELKFQVRSPTAYNSQTLDGTLESNAVIHRVIGDQDILQLDTWYLLVGYLHGSNENVPVSQGRIYDTNGTVVGAGVDWKMSDDTTRVNMTVWLYDSPNVNDALFMFEPTMYEVNGQEPSIEELLSGNPDGDNNGGDNNGGFASENGNLFLETGSLGIGTRNTNDFMLAVAGKTVTEEVQVSLEGDWPDYVFEDSFELPSLDSVREHIKEKGHLKDIPSAKEVKEYGIYLGEMNARLLQKIEELTLYIIEQEDRLKALELQLKQ